MESFCICGIVFALTLGVAAAELAARGDILSIGVTHWLGGDGACVKESFVSVNTKDRS